MYEKLCKACEERGKTWNGSDPRCAFKTGGTFGDNWNCATVGMIRDLCYEGTEHQRGVDYQYCDDQQYATVKVNHIEDLADRPLALWVSWYKNRGETDAMWLLFDDKPPRRPTEQECLLIAQVYSSNVELRGRPLADGPALSAGLALRGAD